MLQKLKEFSIECSLNLHRRTFGVKFKNRVSKTIKEIRKFSKKLTDVNTIRIDPLLNKVLCNGGPKRVPNRIRIRLSKRKYLIDGNMENWVVYINYIDYKYNKIKDKSTFIKSI